ncbi:MAG: hypothetical protein GTN80_06695 [Nitrososphaeria archaeon]|nr:hypothetical protein [Nitrososphaeria archaeon]NIQ33314.1 hypothetical protein [Nitrososphaeria archaeon]
MRTPCEVVVRQILPAFRAIVAKSLIENHGFSQNKAAGVLGTTQASISYYLNSKRGAGLIDRLRRTEMIRKTASKMAEDMASDSLSMPFEAILAFCDLCKGLRTEEIVCALHSAQVQLPDDCKICPDKIF